MKSSQASKPVTLHAPVGATVATTTSTGLAQLDTSGYGRARVTLMAPAATNTSGDNQPRLFKLQHSVDTNASNFADYKVGTVNTVVGTSDFTIEASGNTEGFRQTLDVDIRDSRRYIRVQVQPANSTNYSVLSCVAELSEGTTPAGTGVSVV